MKSTIPCYLLLAVAARLAHAQYCDASTGYPISDDASSPAPDPDSDCDADCQLYYSQQQTEYSNYFNDAVTAGGNSFLSAAGGKRDLRHTSSSVLDPRQSNTYLTCSSVETCFVYENIPLCINTDTGDFTDPTGGYGNILAGTYTAAVDTSSSGGTTTTSSSSSSLSSSGSASSPNGASSNHVGGMTFGAIILSAAFAFLAI